MLLIDGVKYELWTPKKEVEEFHPLVKEHYKEIFGKDSLFIEGNRLKSESGKGSVPDGFVINFGDRPQWHIVEIELSTHQLYDHIVNQVGRFVGGIKNTATQKKIIETIHRYTQDSKKRRAELEEAIGSGEIYKFIADLISKPPVLTVIIEKRTPELDEAIDLLKYSPTEIVEFQTFKREDVSLAVHAHLFEPVYQVIGREAQPLSEPDEDRLSAPQNRGPQPVECVLSKHEWEKTHIDIERRHKDLFPPPGTGFKLETDVGVIDTNCRKARQADVAIQRNLRKWFKAHPELKAGDKLRITVIEPMKKYRLEIVK